ncbi:MAG: hypothetical protein ACKKL4_02500 [Patescibacteria group bacterium]
MMIAGLLFSSVQAQAATVAQVSTGITDNTRAGQVLAQCYSEWLRGKPNQWRLDDPICVRAYWLMSQAYHTKSYKKQHGQVLLIMVDTGKLYESNPAFAEKLDEFTARVRSGEFREDPYSAELENKLPRTTTAAGAPCDDAGWMGCIGVEFQTISTWCTDSHGNRVKVSDEVCRQTPDYTLHKKAHY